MHISLANEVLFGTPTSVSALLEAGLPINEMDEYGFTPLIESAIANKVDIAELLLSKGADPNIADVTGHTALHWAVDNSNVAFCKLLLDHKANPNAYTTAGQPVLTYAVLRGDQSIKNVLYKYKANLNFAQDFINTKLIGHRFGLVGQQDIVNAEGSFIEIDFEGFYLEFTLGLIQNSLQRYVKNFTARHLREYFDILKKLIETLGLATQIIRYQHHTMRLKEHIAEIHALLETDLLLIPVSYEGHAISFVRYGPLLARCDRGEVGRKQGTVVIYYMHRPERFDKNFITDIVYSIQSRTFLEEGIHTYLGLEPIALLPIESQISGNCSWANVEATIPAMLFLLAFPYESPANPSLIQKITTLTMDLYQQWQEWDKDRAIEECLQGMEYASAARRASKAGILGAVLFQKCWANNENDLARAQKILSVLGQPEYLPIIKNYIRAYCTQGSTPLGDNFIQLLKYWDVDYK